MGKALSGELSCPCDRSCFDKVMPLFNWPGRSPGRAIVLPSALVSASALAKCYSFYVKVFYVMGKALSGNLSCPCDRSCLT